MTKILLLLLLSFPVQSGEQEQLRTNPEEELNLPLIMERIAKTSPEGLAVIETVKRSTPVLQKNRSARSLGETIEDCIYGRGQLWIYPIGWEAFKSAGPRWRISFYFRDEAQNYLKATWEYNEDRNVLLPAEFTNATKFWVRRSKNLNP
jgi:hypothetical protein